MNTHPVEAIYVIIPLRQHISQGIKGNEGVGTKYVYIIYSQRYIDNYIPL